MLRSVVLSGAAALLLASAGIGFAAEPGGPERLPNQQEVYQIKLRQAMSAAIEGNSGSGGRLSDDERTALQAFYNDRNGKAFWTDSGSLSTAAVAAMTVIGRAGDYGLKSADYPVPSSGLGKGTTPATPDQLAEAEIELSQSVLHYAHDAHVGRITPDQVSSIIDRGSTPPLPKKVLEGLAKADDAGKYLLGFNPQHPQFELLRKKYLELTGGRAPEPVADTAEVADAPETTGTVDTAAVRIPKGPRLRPGDVHPQIALIRKRLGSFLPPDATPDDNNSYDDVLAETVRKFQAQNSLPDDGVIDRALRRALNDQAPKVTKASLRKAPRQDTGTDSQQVERVLVNMQRWRWMREDMGKFYVFDNVPEFLTRVVDKGLVIFTEKIVAGKPDTPTPTFSQDMQTIEFHPFWNVPNSIKENEILPKLQRGSDIMEVQNLRAFYNGQPVDVYNVDWSTTNIKNFSFQQPPGKENVLGVVKFLFPNHFDVYMHDTPTKKLFDQTVRAYSHGCMRVHNPDQFAAVLLEHDQGWSQGDVARAIATGGNQGVRLQTPIPVHVAYFTSWVQDDGTLSTFGDWYGHDRRMALALNGKTDLLAKEVAVANAKAKAAAPDPGLNDNVDLLTLLFGKQN